VIVRTTGSQLDRVVRCNASAALPQIYDSGDSDDEDDGRPKGSAIHSFLERCSLVGRDEALTEVDKHHRDRCADIELAKLAKQLQLTPELAVAYNWRNDTARILQPAAKRAYDIDDSCEVACTIDVAGVAPDAVYCGDYKSGAAWLPDPGESLQLGLGALALARAFDRDAAELEYIRIRDDGSVRKFRARLDVFGLQAVADRIRGAMVEVYSLRDHVMAGGVPDVVEGRWCRYCPARQHCPAKTALVRHVLGDPQPVPYMQPLTPESALRAYELLAPAKAALKQVEAALFAYAKLTPIPLGVDDDGSERWFGELKRAGNEVLDGRVAHAVLTELYDGELANSAITMEITKKAIGDAVRGRLAPGEKITHVTEKIYDLIRARDGATRPETTSTTEYTVSPDGDMKARRRKAS